MTEELRNVLKNELMMSSSDEDYKNLIMEVLINNNVNFRYKNNSTLLMNAVSRNAILAKLLLESGADPNVINMNGSTALSITIYFRNYALAELLIKYGANTDIIDGLNGKFLLENIHDQFIVEKLKETRRQYLEEQNTKQYKKIK